MNSRMTWLERLAKLPEDCNGQDMTEFALIAGVVSVLIIGSTPPIYHNLAILLKQLPEMMKGLASS